MFFIYLVFDFLGFRIWAPLCVCRYGVDLRKIEASLSLNLLRRRPSFPLPFEVGSLSPAPTVLDRGVGLKEASDDFVNLPNLISISQMVSGPLLGWYTFCY